MRLRLWFSFLALAGCSGKPAQAPVQRSPHDSFRQLVADAAARAPSDAPPNDYTESNLPRWAFATLRDGGYLQRYGFFLKLNPFFQSGLFDADSLVDVAVQIVDRKSGKRGIAFIHRIDKSVHLVGAGTSFGNGGDDFSWLWQWSVEGREDLHEPAVLGRDVLYVGKGDSAGGMIWWNGHEYRWTQWGD